MRDRTPVCAMPTQYPVRPNRWEAPDGISFLCRIIVVVVVVPFDEGAVNNFVDDVALFVVTCRTILGHPHLFERRRDGVQ